LTDRVVTVGAGACGVSAAGTLREEGFEGLICLIGEGGILPYERPPLPKEYLRGEQTLDRAYIRPTDWYVEQSIQMAPGSHVSSIDIEEKVVRFGGGGKGLSFEAS